MAEADVAGVADTWLRSLRGRCRAPAPATPTVDRRRDSRRSTADDGDGGDGCGRRSPTGATTTTTPSSTWRPTSRSRSRPSPGGSTRRRRTRTAGPAARRPRRHAHPARDRSRGVVYGVWRAGGVTVIADRGLGLRGLGRAVRSTRPRWVIGPDRPPGRGTQLRWAPRARPHRRRRSDRGRDTTRTEPRPSPAPTTSGRAVHVGRDRAGQGGAVPPRSARCPARRAGPTYSITPTDRLVAAFAPFALYGPALGITTALPDCRRHQARSSSPRRCSTRRAVASAQRSRSRLRRRSPTWSPPTTRCSDRTAGLRLVLSAGAPVPSRRCGGRRARPGCDAAHAVRDDRGPPGRRHRSRASSSSGTRRSRWGRVCRSARRRRRGADRCARIRPRRAPRCVGTESVGEILIRAPWVSEGYLGLWATRARRTARRRGWHRSGDVGHVDADGRLWVEGRACT